MSDLESSIPQLWILNSEMNLNLFPIWEVCSINFWSWTDGDKGLWQICMHHWTVHAKVEFQKCPWDVRPWELHSTTLDPELRNEFKSFSNLGPFQICLFHNFWSWTDGDKGLWQICMHHWTVHAKVEFPRFLPDVRPGEGSFHNFWSCKLTFTDLHWYLL